MVKDSASLLFFFFTWSHSACFPFFFPVLFSFVIFVVSLRVCLSACCVEDLWSLTYLSSQDFERLHVIKVLVLQFSCKF
jgi:hypothetical protein